MILDEIKEIVDRQHEEMHIENINALDLWARKLGISHDDLFDFIESEAKEIHGWYRGGTDIKTALMSGWMAAFVMGYAVAERKGDGSS
jgi:hypothetical protein